MLTEAIKELKEEIEAKKKEEGEENAETTEEEKPEEEVKEEEKVEEEDKKEEEKKEETPDQLAFQKLRREKSAAEKRAKELEEKLAAKENPQEVEVEKEDPVLLEIKNDHLLTKAEKEFQVLESQYKRSNPEYDAVAKEYTAMLAQSIRTQNPRLSLPELVEKTKQTILLKAARYMEKGYENPVEELFYEAKELGITGKALQKETEEEIKPDMKKVARNREKSAGMAATGGESKGQLTKQAAADLTNAEWSRLKPDEKRRLLAS